jgi:tetratricopeptide (TPR) repeat protein
MAAKSYSINKIILAIVVPTIMLMSCAHTPEATFGATQLFDSATENLKDQRFEESKYEFRQFYSKHPNSEYADDALFRLGYISCLQGNYADARDYFSTLIDDYLKSEWVFDAEVWKSLLDSWIEKDRELKSVKSKLSSMKPRDKAETGDSAGDIEALQEKLDRLREDNRKLREIIESM